MKILINYYIELILIIRMVILNEVNPRRSTTHTDEENKRVQKIIVDQRSKQDAFAPRDLTLLYFSNWYSNFS